MSKFQNPCLNDVLKIFQVYFLFTSWLDPLIWIGYKRELKQEDLYATPEGARSQILLEKFEKLVINLSTIHNVCVCVCAYACLFKDCVCWCQTVVIPGHRFCVCLQILVKVNKALLGICGVV